ncbi:MAG: EH signature domain-containing protein [Gallionella sp.]|jgi:hypothetical protein
MNELAQLQSSLSHVFCEVLSTSLSWENLKSVKRLQEINGKLDGLSSAPTNTSINEVVAAYRSSQRVTTFRELKYLCYGFATRMQDDWVLLGNDKLRGDLLVDVERLSESRQRLRCFQALLSSYFSFSRYDEQTTKEAFAGWEILRDWLARQRTQFALDGRNGKIRLPNWFIALTKHENLLTNNPCHRYGEDMLHGNNSKIEEARQCLGILTDSWVMEETILSQVRAAAEFGDDPFKSHLENLLKLVQGQTEVKVSPLLKIRAVALLVSRYALCTSKLEHPALRDAAVSIVGNPWLKRMAWDAWVKKIDGQPDSEAREMVNGWLKRRLITDFFAVLSEDGQADQRRLNYWLRFEPAIEDLWLALGPDAMRNRSQPYRELRERSVGRLLRLDNSGPSNNNAFIMRIGNCLIVEFGITGNACYLYHLQPVPFDLNANSIHLSALKNKKLGVPHNHVAIGWENNFDQAICPKVGYRPSFSNAPTNPTIPSQVAGHNFSYVDQYVKKFAIRTENNRGAGGAFWVLTQKGKHPEIDRNLESWGFKYKPERGWWKQ